MVGQAYATYLEGNLNREDVEEGFAVPQAREHIVLFPDFACVDLIEDLQASFSEPVLRSASGRYLGRDRQTEGQFEEPVQPEMHATGQESLMHNR